MVSRTLRRKLGYVSSIALLAAAACGALLWLDAPFGAWVLTVLVLLLPGRIAGHYFRDLFTGRRLMDARRFAEAISHFERFLERLQARPRLKRLIWLSAGIYTHDVEAMALNNIGAARLELGQLDQVESPLRRALAVDPDYPLPYVNLARLAVLRGDVDAALAASTAAKRLGYDGSRIDALIHRASGALAALEGDGKVRGDA
jgi:tetratricopeptide (TPR) repeat protein